MVQVASSSGVALPASSWKLPFCAHPGVALKSGSELSTTVADPVVPRDPVWKKAERAKGAKGAGALSFDKEGEVPVFARSHARQNGGIAGGGVAEHGLAAFTMREQLCQGLILLGDLPAERVGFVVACL